MFDSNELTDNLILVVGGAGFVGSNLCKELLKLKPSKLIIVDNLLSSHIENITNIDSASGNSIVEFILGSISDDEILQQLPDDLDYIFHLACYHGNQSSIINPLEDHKNNSLTSLKLFDYYKKSHRLKKIVYSAAGCAVAEKTCIDAVATTEDSPVSLHHDSPYSISKIIGELYANYYYKQYGMPIIKARFQNCYGPGEILGAGQWRGSVHTVWRNVVPVFIWKALHGEALPLENQGQSSRDFIYVADIVEGLLRCALLGNPGEVYNLASGREVTIYDLAIMINDLVANTTPLELRPAREWDNSGKRFGSTKKSKKQLDFEAGILLKQGLEKTIVWTEENYDLIKSCIKQHDYFMKMSAINSVK